MIVGPLHELSRVQIIPRSLDEVFAFYADARNLEQITPPFLRFRIVTPDPIAMRAGTLIDYRLALFGVPFGWTTRIDAFEPGRRFVDRQVRGPYALWHHQHEFVELAGGTAVVDLVHYRLPLGPIGSLAHQVGVRGMLRRIFDYRAQRLREIFTEPTPRQRELVGVGNDQGVSS